MFSEGQGLRLGVKGVSAGEWRKPQRHEAMWKKRGRKVSFLWRAVETGGEGTERFGPQSVESVCTIRQGG